MYFYKTKLLKLMHMYTHTHTHRDIFLNKWLSPWLQDTQYQTKWAKPRSYDLF